MVTSGGKVVTGKGATRAHLTDMLKESIAGAFQVGPLQIFVAGPTDLKWTVQLIVGCSAEERQWRARWPSYRQWEESEGASGKAHLLHVQLRVDPWVRGAACTRCRGVPEM